MRKPFQGLLNVVRFNWHFFAGSLLLTLVLAILLGLLGGWLRVLVQFLLLFTIVTTVVSLLVTFYVYDLSGLYNMYWLEPLKMNGHYRRIVNIHAGFDETSTLLQSYFKPAELLVLDFYDPTRHTEVSIRRARKAYPPFPGTLQTHSKALVAEDESADLVFNILAAHEIRDHGERQQFFQELKRIAAPNGRIIVTEHLRDTANFLAYNLGCFHFLSRKTWLQTFQSAELKLIQEFKLNPFITTFILEKNGNSS